MGDCQLQSGSISHFRSEECVGVQPCIGLGNYGSHDAENAGRLGKVAQWDKPL